jgi:negative regulator of sigma E activity
VVGLGDALRAEADEAFPAERLAVQQAQIARRLETLERPARVIAFPKAARAVISGHSHVRRWVTVAAAAGLIAGIGLGQVVPLRQAFQKQQAAGQSLNLTIPQTVKIAEQYKPVQTSEDDDELLTDAFARPRVSTLSALDEMTPRSRDFPK